MDHQPDTGDIAAGHVPDTGDLIDKSAPDPQPEQVTDPTDPSYCEPAHAAVRVNPHNLLPTLDAPKWVDESIAVAEAQLTAQIRRMTGRNDIRVVVDRTPLDRLRTEADAIYGGPPTGTVGTSLPDAPDTAEATQEFPLERGAAETIYGGPLPDTTAEADPEGCA